MKSGRSNESPGATTLGKKSAGSDRRRVGLFSSEEQKVEEPPFPEEEGCDVPVSTSSPKCRRWAPAPPAPTGRAARVHRPYGAEMRPSAENPGRPVASVAYTAPASENMEQSERHRGRRDEEPVPQLEVAAAVAEEIEAVKKERIRLGLCPGCGMQLFEIRGGFLGLISRQKYVPLTEAGIVYKGVCLSCHPELSNKVGRVLRTSSSPHQNESQDVVGVSAPPSSLKRNNGLTCFTLNGTRFVKVVIVAPFIALLLVAVITLSIILSNKTRADAMTPSVSEFSPGSWPSPSVGTPTSPPHSPESSAPFTLPPTAEHSETSPPSSTIELCDFNRTYTCGTCSRGLWLQAPVDFCIVGLRVPNEANQPTQNVEVFLMDSPPPNSETTSVGSVFYAAGEPTAGDHIVVPDPKIDVASGKYVGLLGTAGDAKAHNSYCAHGTGGMFKTSIGGHEVTLNRFRTDNNIALNPAPNYYSKNPYEIGRVEMLYWLGKCDA